MQLDELSLRLRPRGPWEAMDLGAALLRANWKPVLTAWLALVLPVVVLIYALGPAPSSWVWLIVWWLKPLFDRVPLYVLSRSVFGATPRLHEVIRAVPGLLRTGVFASLTYLRFDPWRSFNLPVRVLEGLRGREAGARGALLRKRAGGHALWLTLTCLAFWVVLSVAMLGLIYMLMPDASNTADNEKTLWQLLQRPGPEIPLWLYYTDAALGFIALSVIELVYVASGFTLYLNRRILLEGWDIEVALRALAARVSAQQEKQAWAGAAGLPVSMLGILAILMLGIPLPSAASEASSGQIIQEVLAAPEFEQYRQSTRWKYIGPRMQDEAKPSERRLWSDLGAALAQLARVAIWIALAVLIIALLWHWSRARARAVLEPERRSAPPPARASGKRVPDTPLPEDIVQAAQALLAAGQVRDALGLMYRAAAQRLGARAAETESDCLKRLRGRDESLRGYVTNLVRIWQRAAYADEASLEAAQALLHNWPQFFPYRSETVSEPPATRAHE